MTQYGIGPDAVFRMSAFGSSRNLPRSIDVKRRSHRSETTQNRLGACLYRVAFPNWGRRFMLIDLVPEFLSAVKASDPLAAYRRYIDDHLPVLKAYWHNYIIDLDSPHAESVFQRTVEAERKDLYAMLDSFDVARAANDTIARCEELFEIDCPVDVYLTVGVGGANAGELVVGGRGIAFVCLEHFTGRANADTLGLGLRPQLISLWLAHEIAHAVRYLSPGSCSEMKRIVAETGGYYDYWETGSRAAFRELLANEGLAVAAARMAVPGFEPWDYLGYGRRQYRRLRELEAFLTHHLHHEMDNSGLGYRLRYLAGGASPTQRLVGGKVIPERSGYYLGHRMVETAVAELGLSAALRTDAVDFEELEDRAADQTA